MTTDKAVDLRPGSVRRGVIASLGGVAPVVAVAAVVALVATLAGCGGSTGSRGLPNPMGLQGTLQEPATPKPDFTLTDTAGHPFNLSTQTAGDVTLLYFGYTHCPDVCPTTMADLALGLEKVSPAVRTRVKVVFVTTDPNRDTEGVIRSWLNAFNPTFIGLTGTSSQIDAAERAVGMPPATVVPLGNGNYSVDHAAYVLAFTTDDEAHVVYPDGYGASTWAHDLPRLVKWRAS
jgi:protein SCO1/2